MFDHSNAFEIGTHVKAPMPTLEQALKEVPMYVCFCFCFSFLYMHPCSRASHSSLGFNIEIKYPLLESQTEHQMNPAEINAFLDRVLDDVFKFAGSRRIVFSCTCYTYTSIDLSAFVCVIYLCQLTEMQASRPTCAGSCRSSSQTILSFFSHVQAMMKGVLFSHLCCIEAMRLSLQT